MRNRQPAGRGQYSFLSRVTRPVARSPAERLEPTRPPRRGPYHVDRGPSRVRPLLGFINGCLSFVVLLMLLVGGLAYSFDTKIDAPGPLEKLKLVVIPKGEGSHEIAWRLEHEGIVTDRRLFVAGYYWAKLAAWLDSAKPVQLRAGDYEMPAKSSVRQVVAILSEGRTVSYKVTIPEGLTSYQIVERLKADPNLEGEIGAVPPEGTLLPETFIVQRGAHRQAIVDSMLAASRKLMEKLWEQRKKQLPLKSWEEAVTLASIVEKETGRQDERERVAAVFINRLKQNMRLQSDPTILYGLENGKAVWGRSILKSEIAQKTSHNTYQIDGLPPTPICNPGRAAIQAVLNPADTKELYFVADGAGGHIFAETLKDHNANVQKWRAAEKDIKAKTAPSTPVMPSGGDTPNGQAVHVNAPPTHAVIRRPPPKKAAEKEKAKAPAPAAPASPDASAAGGEEVLPWAKKK